MLKNKLSCSFVIILAILSGCTVPKKDGKEYASLDEAIDAMVPRSEELVLMSLISEYHKQKSKWPENMDELKSIFHELSLNNSKVSSSTNKDLNVKTASFVHKNEDLVVNYTNNAGEKGGLILRQPSVQNSSYQFCILNTNSEVCSNFKNFSSSISK